MALFCPLINLALMGMVPLAEVLGAIRMTPVPALLGEFAVLSVPQLVLSGLSNDSCSVWALFPL